MIFIRLFYGLKNHIKQQTVIQRPCDVEVGGSLEYWSALGDCQTEWTWRIMQQCYSRGWKTWLWCWPFAGHENARRYLHCCGSKSSKRTVHVCDLHPSVSCGEARWNDGSMDTNQVVMGAIWCRRWTAPPPGMYSRLTACVVALVPGWQARRLLSPSSHFESPLLACTRWLGSIRVGPCVVLRWGRGAIAPNTRALPANVLPWLQELYAVLRPANSYAGGGRFLKVGVIVVHLALWPVFWGRRLKVNFLHCPHLFSCRTARE